MSSFQPEATIISGKFYGVMMAGKQVYISGMGIISALGSGVGRTRQALAQGRSGLRELSLFTLPPEKRSLVGEIPEPVLPGLPRTHQLALTAAREAMATAAGPPDAVVLGTTTGGMLSCELPLKEQITDPEHYRWHGLGTVARLLADEFSCPGPALTLSTACSSGAAAIALAAAMIRYGLARTVLAGGADGLCRMTVHGFSSLQVVDPEGARPFDRNRRGMSVAEGAALLLMTADRPEIGCWGEIAATGLSCDAYHPSSPHPEGDGALLAMERALSQAGIPRQAIDYINLHGTGTPVNDKAEARAIRRLFQGGTLPPASSVKGALGHSLAAAGAIEAVIAALCLADQQIPANTGLVDPDPDLDLAPVNIPLNARVQTVLSNSFGFGGNNASILVSKCRTPKPEAGQGRPFPNKECTPAAVPARLTILGNACITGAGRTADTLKQLARSGACGGRIDLSEISRDLDPRSTRRLKRLPKIALALANAAIRDAGPDVNPSAVFAGSGWGALSETNDFLDRLFASNEVLSSPTDFVGSVHNAPAGSVALALKAQGPNITASSGDTSFEQALLAADLLTRDLDSDPPFILFGADEYHPALTPLFDRSSRGSAPVSDGGGAFCLTRTPVAGAPTLACCHYGSGLEAFNAAGRLASALGLDRTPGTADRYGAVFYGIPAAEETLGQAQLKQFRAASGLDRLPWIDYRLLTGEFASASAVAAVLATRILLKGILPPCLVGQNTVTLESGTGILILGFGTTITAMEVMPG